jgi:predicted PurR-regulated permease PerM
VEVQSDYIRKRALVAVLIFVSLVFLWMLRNFLLTLLLAGIFSSMLQPIYRWALPRVKGKTLWASVSTLGIFVGVILVPTLLLMILVGAQAVGLSESVAPTISTLVEHPEEVDAYLEKLPFYEELAPYRNDVIQKAGEIAKQVGALVFKGLSGATKGTLLFFFHAFILLYAMFFFLTGGRKVVERILLYLPLPAEDEERILERFVSVSRATIKGTFIIGAIQGGLAGVALGIGGVPNWVFWGAVMAVLSVIPGIGAALVWVPACAYLALTGHGWAALGVAAFCAIVVGSADNVLRPKLVGEDAKMSDIMILLSTLGGLTMFGAPGVIVGPIIAALFVTLWEIYGEVFAHVLPAVPEKEAPERQEPPEEEPDPEP